MNSQHATPNRLKYKMHLKQQAIENLCRSTLYRQHRLPYQQDRDDRKGALGKYQIKTSVTGVSLL